MVQEHRVCNRKSDGSATDLGEGNETDGHRNFLGLNFDLGDREARLSVHAASDTEQDRVTVYLRGGGVDVDGVHESTADEGKAAANKVPRHIVSVFGHQSAVEDDGKDEEAHERKETNACLYG